ncbi:MAG: AEC family transporter [Ruminococcus sp.]|nr:AEC family transporter [Ruminococcus sp.]
MIDTDTGLLIGRQILIMFIILAIGALCYLKGLITKEGTKQLSAVELQLVNPLLIFMSYQKEYNSKLLNGLLWSFALSAISFAVMILLSYVFIGKNREDKDIERFASVYSNCGFIGIPLINGIYGTDGVLYLTAYVTFFNLLVWTHGYMTMKGERDFSSFLKALKSPSVIAVFLGLICYLTNIRLPDVPASAMQYVSDMNTPLAMLIAGATAAQTNILKAMKKPVIYLVSALKLLVFPACAFAVCRFLGAPQIVLMTVTIAAACPVATTGTMFAIQMDRKPELCSEFFTITTLLSALTLPLITIAGTALS